MIKENLITLRSQIIALEKKYARKKNAVSILAVSKQQPVSAILAAIAAGQHCFGENYVNEALQKIQYLNDPALEWHFIGKIQANKTKEIAEHFAWVHSLDREKIALRLDQQRPAHLPPLNVCIEVNLSNEETKGGVAPDEVKIFAQKIKSLTRLKLRGLMAIPAPMRDMMKQRKMFHRLLELFQALQQDYPVDTLSMGMSDDYEAAIAEGATIIRLGTRIFGKRC